MTWLLAINVFCVWISWRAANWVPFGSWIWWVNIGASAFNGAAVLWILTK